MPNDETKKFKGFAIDAYGESPALLMIGCGY